MRYRFRRAAPRDRDTVFAFCASTWPNGDYIPLVWDAWLAEPHGAYVVGVDAQDTALAVGKLSLAPHATPGEPSAEGWIEGIRVAPAERLQGWGRALVAYLLDTAWAQDLEVVRYLTDGTNTPMHRVAAALGFEARGGYHPHRVEAGGRVPICMAQPTETAALWERALAADPDAEPVRWRGWAGARATLPWFEHAGATGRALVAADGRAVAVVDPPDPEPAGDGNAPRPARVRRDAQVSLLAGEPAGMEELLAAARVWAATAGAAEVFALLPVSAVPAAASGGWSARTEAPMAMYGRARH